jgi:hypothetical protein
MWKELIMEDDPDWIVEELGEGIPPLCHRWFT